MNCDLKLLGLLLKKGLIKTSIFSKKTYQKHIITLEMNDRVRNLVEGYFQLNDDDGKKKYINEITLALNDHIYNISTAHFFITRKQRANFAAIFCELPETRLKKLSLKKDDNTDDDTDYTVIAKGTKLFDKITAQDIQRYGFYFRPYDQKNINSIIKNMIRIRKKIIKLGVIAFTSYKENTSNKEIKDRFLQYYCKIYDYLVLEKISDEKLEDKVKHLLDFNALKRH
ncbi:MAG: hypothetical protein J5672_05195 [Verrucomicrobia bacterium]|nr:hypothetical protein [Verrucomicrobiota bacterium]